MTDHSNSAADRFPATRWSALEAARSSNQLERARAINTLCAAYWKPVYKYIRLRWNRPAPDAQDLLTQGFFVQLLERGLLEEFDPAKSRLRTYLRLCAAFFSASAMRSLSRNARGVLHRDLKPANIMVGPCRMR